MEQQALQQLAQERLDAHTQGEPSNSTSHDGAARKVGADEPLVVSAPAVQWISPQGRLWMLQRRLKPRRNLQRLMQAPCEGQAPMRKRQAPMRKSQAPMSKRQAPVRKHQALCTKSKPYVQTAASLHFHVQA